MQNQNSEVSIIPPGFCQCGCGAETSVFKETNRNRGQIKGEHARFVNGHGARMYRGHMRWNYKHGLSKSPAYIRHKNMIDRCDNPDNPAFHRYGGRGISYYPPWKDLVRYVQDVEAEIGKPDPEDLEVDRIDNDGHYEPGNIRWATDTMQSRNRSTTVRYAIFGEELTAMEVQEKYGVKDGTFENRLKAGMTPEQAATTPVMSKVRRLRSSYLFNGEQLTVTEIAHRLGMKVGTLTRRLRESNLTFEEAVTMRVGKKGSGKLYPFRGEMLNLVQIGSILSKEIDGMNHEILYGRINKGWNFQKAITTPPMRKRAA